MNNKKKKPNFFTKFLWWTAGADQDILLESTHSDRVKYMTLGGIILATGLMAALAGGYAFYTIFSPKGDALAGYDQVKSTSHYAIKESIHTATALLSVIFGLLWGMMIFNIDRFIVTSTGTGDGTEKITWDEFKSAIPRLIMGAIIAVTISKPVEIRMFKSEIDAELHIEQQKKAADFEINTRAKYEVDLNRLESEIQAIRSKENALLADVKNAEKELTEQLQGRAGAPAGDGKLSQALRNLRDSKHKELNNYKSAIEPKLVEFETKRAKTLAAQELELKNNVKVASGLDGLLERIKLAHEIAGWGISLFITLLFLVIELTPIFFKLMLIKSPYDYLVENEKELVKARAGIHIEYNYYPAEDENGVILEGTERHLVRLLKKRERKLGEVGIAGSTKKTYSIRNQKV